jgi:hypothetical protein
MDYKIGSEMNAKIYNLIIMSESPGIFFKHETAHIPELVRYSRRVGRQEGWGGSSVWWLQVLLQTANRCNVPTE